MAHDEPKPAKKGRGRPRSMPHPGRDLRCTVTPEEHAEIEAARRKAGASQQDFARRAVVEAARRALAEPAG